MASSAQEMLRAARPLARAATSVARASSMRSATAAALRRLDTAASPRAQRHPLTPAAVRVERARSQRRGERADQTAVTVWFGQGPSLPVPGGADPMRTAIRLGTGIVGAAALAALTVIAARREESRATIVDGPPAKTIT